MALPLSGKVAIVTGSSRGIGASIAKRLASDGASVVINYFGNAGAANEVVQQIESEGKGAAVAIRADLSSTTEGTRLIDETIQRFGKLDILVLNAGLMRNNPLEALDEQTFDEHFNINVKVPLFMVKEAAKHLKSGTCQTSCIYGCFSHPFCVNRRTRLLLLVLDDQVLERAAKLRCLHGDEGRCRAADARARQGPWRARGERQLRRTGARRHRALPEGQVGATR